MIVHNSSVFLCFHAHSLCSIYQDTKPWWCWLLIWALPIFAGLVLGLTSGAFSLLSCSNFVAESFWIYLHGWLIRRTDLTAWQIHALLINMWVLSSGCDSSLEWYCNIWELQHEVGRCCKANTTHGDSSSVTLLLSNVNWCGIKWPSMYMAGMCWYETNLHQTKCYFISSKDLDTWCPLIMSRDTSQHSLLCLLSCDHQTMRYMSADCSITYSQTFSDKSQAALNKQ